MRVLQLLGTNAAGKSSVFRALVARNSSVVYQGALNRMTSLPRSRIMLFGDYVGTSSATWPEHYDGRKIPATSWPDNFKGKDKQLVALDEVVANAQHFGFPAVGWEGIVIMTRPVHRALVARGYRPLYIVLGVTEAVAFQRILGRSGKTRDQLKSAGGNVVSRIGLVERLARDLRLEGADVRDLDGARPLDDVVDDVAAILQTL